jgi:hypothetical protein
MEIRKMRKFATLLAFATVFSALALAEEWKGPLVDASCQDVQQMDKCQPTAATTAFAIVVDGKPVKLDAAGNAKVSEALKNRADRSADPNAPAKPSSVINIKVVGTKEGDTIKAETVEVS